ncbi:MAG: hypothetical protein GX491_06810 [Chloroflexi bacterium]|nr:hypothetical protein [Chloroflexota bacterium]
MAKQEKKQQADAEFEIGEVIDANEVPNWARRPPKWQKLIDRIAELEPGQSLPVTFPNVQVASRARNTVRDTINLRTGLAVIRTRMVEEENGSATVYFTRLPDDQVVEEKREEPEIPDSL